MRKVAGGEASAVPHTTFVGHSARQAATNPMILKQGGPIETTSDEIAGGDKLQEGFRQLPEAEGPEGGSCDCPKACMLDKLYAAGMIAGNLDAHPDGEMGAMNNPEDEALAEEVRELMEGGGEPEGPI